MSKSKTTTKAPKRPCKPKAPKKERQESALEAVAINNHKVAIIFWKLAKGEKIPGCLGFSVRRVDVKTGKATPLPAMVPFKGTKVDPKKPGTTETNPVQGFTWKDVTGTQGQTYYYEVVPMTGTPGNLKAREDLKVVTNKVTLTDAYGKYIQARFTGLLSTRKVAEFLDTKSDGTFDLKKLQKAINDPKSPLRLSLSSGLPDMIVKLFARAKAIGGRIVAYNYELSDPQIVDLMVANAKRLSIILSNTGKDDATNKAARARLHKAGADIHDRFLPERSIGHNKFMVLVDKAGIGIAVLSGSTNMTVTAFCCQSNNMFTVESRPLAKLFLEYWALVKADKDQAQILRKADAIKKTPVVLPDGTKITVWFSPNTKDEEKPKTGAATPPDLQEVFQRMDGAAFGILFLAFMPGWPSIFTKMLEINKSGKKIVMRGAVSSKDAMPRQKMTPTMGSQDVVVAASAIEKDFGPFIKELLKLPDAHAIIHSKVMVLLGPGWVVITGSHNLGFKASYSNDENLCIFENNKALALAYLANILDVYGHYRARKIMNSGRSKWDGFLAGTDDWQNYHLKGAPRQEMDMWVDFLTTAT